MERQDCAHHRRRLALEARGANVIATDMADFDVTDAAAFRRVVSNIGRLDYLFNNASTAVAGEAHERTHEHWDYVLQVNLHGTINGILAAYPVMLRQKSGHIVNIASSPVSAPFLVPYAASKHAVVGLSTSLRIEAADYGARVSVVCPAAVERSKLAISHSARSSGGTRSAAAWSSGAMPFVHSRGPAYRFPKSSLKLSIIDSRAAKG